MISVVCVWVRGNVDYSAEYVVKLRNMVGRHLEKPFAFVCLTDRPEELPHDIDARPITPYPQAAGWWNKIKLFAPGIFAEGERVLYLDLDIVIVGALWPIVNFPAPFALCPPGGNFTPTGYRIVRRFNSSVMVWNGGEQTDLFTDFPGPEADGGQGLPLWGDQDWIGLRKPFAATMPAAWFPRVRECWHGSGEAARVVLCKKPKNAAAAAALPWVAKAWC
jgi:hypothetical protein